MIPAHELRLGNWYSNGEKLFTLHTADFMDFLNEAQVNDGAIKNIFPIPLTTEILQACGFKPYGSWAMLWIPTRAAIRFYEWNAAECDLWQDDKYYAFKHGHLKYLHQLQNLFYSLTGEELPVKLSTDVVHST